MFAFLRRATEGAGNWFMKSWYYKKKKKSLTAFANLIIYLLNTSSLTDEM